MLKNVYRALVICLLSIILTSLIAVPALAFDARTGSTVTVAAGEVIDGDIYLAGSSIIVDGTVNGDVFAAAQTITINGAVNGGVTLAAQTITLNGKVANGARLAGQTITVYSDIGRDLVVVGAEVTLAGAGSVHGDLVVNGGVVQVNGRVDGGMLGNNSEVTISGSVGGNIELEVNKLTLTSTADVKGNLKYTSANQAVIQSGAKIGGTTNHIPAPAKQTRQMFPGMMFGLAVAWKIYSFLAMLLIGIIIILISKRRLTLMANAIASSPWPSLGWGP